MVPKHPRTPTFATCVLHIRTERWVWDLFRQNMGAQKWVQGVIKQGCMLVDPCNMYCWALGR